MKFYFSTKALPHLENMPLTERLAAVHNAQKKMTGPEKLLLNVLKMLIVIPVFVFIVQTATDWMAIFWALIVTLLYPLVVKPVHYGICAKYIPNPTSKGE